jgi:hypothetical protein
VCGLTIQAIDIKMAANCGCGLIMQCLTVANGTRSIH